MKSKLAGVGASKAASLALPLCASSARADATRWSAKALALSDDFFINYVGR